VLFGAFAGYAYWFPKAFGFRLDDRFGRAAFWFWVTGFYVAFMPLYILGLEGMTRRMQHYDVASWQPWLIVAACGAGLILCGIACQVAQLVVSIRDRQSLRDRTGDPWDGRTLEWATASPPPAFNFAVLPNVTGVEAYWGMKQKAIQQRRLTDLPDYKPIELPRNSPTGFVVAFFAVVTGFALIWHIWWMVIVGLIGAFATFVAFAWRDHSEYKLPAAELARIDHERRQARVALVEGREPGIARVTYSEPAVHGAHKADPSSETGASNRGPEPKRIVTGYGFWIFLLSDFILFSGFYAAYAVLSHATAGGPTPGKLFDLRIVAIETACLLLSSFVCGMASLASNARNMLWTQIAYFITGALGLGFLILEFSEFGRMLSEGAGPGRSAFLSAFFALVGLHGFHVTAGLLWLGTMMAQFWAKGFRPDVLRRGMCFALFWHALDIIWVGIFTNVYLLGTSP
jgi:cytochrome o ubiquinol oxidase subunit 1